MTAWSLLGKPVAAALQTRTRSRAEAFHQRAGRPPRLAIVALGDDPAADRYVRQIERQAGNVAVEVAIRRLSAEIDQAQLDRAIDDLNDDEGLDTILVQLPLPAGLDQARLADRIDPAKDVDGVSPRNVGRLAQGRWAPVPNTAQAGLALLDHYEIGLAGRRVVIVGRSPIVGRPLGFLCLSRDATITFCHTRTRDLAEVTRQAEILLVAAGRPGLIDGSDVAPGAIVLDFGTTVGPDGRLTGDVDAVSVEPVAGALTPVPGGIGPVTTACLLSSVVDLAERRTAGP
ncbi:MAG TPA: bifunctional 5,10-methylenetetrahydrofolate dehydrogenase/5,10-methenyltetrahydrofolate cyclohydrolase [Dehalococcoidia bacterium]|nr:bifunctional 5,10-methylenetetrahydrofolate dehydrogenase/5,10-methenyltetrahydrofolate cyclohydrolase [Dehalococcoidia bacterium]